MPFWIWKRGGQRRHRLFVVKQPGGVSLWAADESAGELTGPPQERPRQWPALEAAGFTIPTRALTTTLSAWCSRLVCTASAAANMTRPRMPVSVVPRPGAAGLSRRDRYGALPLPRFPEAAATAERLRQLSAIFGTTRSGTLACRMPRRPPSRAQESGGARNNADGRSRGSCRAVLSARAGHRGIGPFAQDESATAGIAVE